MTARDEPLPADGDRCTKPGPLPKLPGSDAATVNVPGFLNSLPRLLLKSKCGLQGFLLSIVQSHQVNDACTSMAGVVWPCPVPYPEVFRAGAAQRVESAHFKRLCCLQIIVLDWYFLGCPAAAPASLRLGARLNAKQWSVVRMIEHLAVDRNFPISVEAVDMGRAAAKIEDFQKCMDVLGRATADLHNFEGMYAPVKPSKTCVFEHRELRCGSIAGRSDHDPVVTAKPLFADRLHFPGPPRFDPRKFFDDCTLERYDRPISTGLSPDDVDEIPPKVSVRATQQNKLDLYRKLALSGRLQPIRTGTFYDGYTSGLFAVGKDQLRDRMVLDGRPANILDVGQRKWCLGMASASSLCGLYLQAGCDLCVSGEDLRDFFYQFRVNDERISRNTLCSPLTLAEAKYVFGEHFSWPDDVVEVGLSTLAMGDCCAVEFAQCSHLAMCLQFGVAAVGELLSLRGSVPRGLLQVGIIVDDLIVLEQILKTQRNSKVATKADARMAAARNAYNSVGLESNPKKAFANEDKCRFWGLEIDGVAGLLRPSSLRLWPICLVTMRVVTLGLCTVSLIEALAGSWVSLLGLRRKLFCILDLIFEPLGIADQKAIIRLSPELLSELGSLVVLATLSCVNLRADFLEQVVATDASEGWMAGVSAFCPRNIVAEASRFSLRKGVWTKLLSPIRAWQRGHGLLQPDHELPDDEVVYQTHPLWILLARCIQYKTGWRCEVRRKTDINILELRAHLKYKSIRALHGIDSQVCLGAVIKGRSASSSLNAEMKRSVAPAIGSDIYGMYMYFHWSWNPADGPTRDADTPDVSAPLPEWWNDVIEQRFDSFDAWLEDHGAHSFLAGIDFSELYSCDAVDLRPNSVIRRKRGNRLRARVRRVNAEEDADGVCLDHQEMTEVEMLLRTFKKSQFFYTGNCPDFSLPGGLDLFSGRCGVAKAMIELGCPWVLTFDYARSANEDLLQCELCSKIEKLICLGAFLTLGAAPICSSFSVAITPPVRSHQYPRGIPGLRHSMRQRVKEGNSHSDWMRHLVSLVEAVGMTWWVENPDLSWWWRQRSWRQFRNSHGPKLFRLCFCRFGTKWRKATRIATNGPLSGVTMWCQCTRPHLQLRGMCAAKRIPWTLVAQPYPRGLCRMLAASLCTSAGWVGKSKLNVARCSRCDTLRVGEAQNPGPRGRKQQHAFSLEEVQTLSAATLAIQARELGAFFSWCRLRSGNTNFESLFHLVPAFLPTCLRAYGDYSFQRGGSLFNFRHLLLAAQRWCSASRPCMGAG